MQTNLKWVEASDITAYNQDSNSFFTASDDLLSLNTEFSISFNNSHHIGLIYYHNFYDSIISSNRSDIININYQFESSLMNEKLGVDGMISFAYYSENNSEFSFDYFRNIPTSGNSFEEDKNYSIGVNVNVSIADVILTFRANNLLHRLPIDGDYSIRTHELFNPINSMISFGILWEFDD